MKIEIENYYSVEIQKWEDRVHYKSFGENILHEFRDWTFHITIPDEAELQMAFTEFLSENYDLVPEEVGDGESIDHYSTELNILNWDQILPLLNDLIVTPKEISCCEKAPYGSNYCPTCGTQLIFTD
jgi:hypothetical protein